MRWHNFFQRHSYSSRQNKRRPIFTLRTLRIDYFSWLNFFSHFKCVYCQLNGFDFIVSTTQLWHCMFGHFSLFSLCQCFSMIRIDGPIDVHHSMITWKYLIVAIFFLPAIRMRLYWNLWYRWCAHKQKMCRRNNTMVRWVCCYWWWSVLSQQP